MVIGLTTQFSSREPCTLIYTSAVLISYLEQADWLASGVAACSFLENQSSKQLHTRHHTFLGLNNTPAMTLLRPLAMLGYMCHLLTASYVGPGRSRNKSIQSESYINDA